MPAITASIHDRLATVLNEKFGVAPDKIGPTATFEDLDFDSLALIELALSLQQEFEVFVGDDELSPEQGLAAAVDLLTGKGAA